MQIQNWQQELDAMLRDPTLTARWLQLSEVNGYGSFAAIVAVGESTAGHYHPEASEKYHIVKGQGILLTLPVDQLETGASPIRQPIKTGMTVDIPGRIVHRLINDSNEPLVFFFECPVSHMDKENPMRTGVKDFGGP